jgi:hypothetical protein
VTNQGKNIERPGRKAIVTEAIILGALTTVLAWLVVTASEDLQWFDWTGLAVYGLLAGWVLSSLIRMIWRQRAQEPGRVIGYVDADGDRWFVRPDGSLGFSPGNGSYSADHAGTWPLDLVEREFGPLEPVYG